jgi:hypothetical protein
VVIITTTIKKTTNYKDFKRVIGNRLLNKEHFSRLKKSVQHKNLLHLNPIIVNEKMEIIDGQHRLQVCKTLGLPVYYVMEKGLNFADVVQMNSNVKDWGLLDYLQSYCEQGYKDYLGAKTFANQYDLSPSTAIAILSMGAHVTRAGYHAFKDGLFKITDYDRAEEFVQKLKEVARYTTSNTWKDRDFIRALSISYERGIDHEDLMSHIERANGLIMRQANVKDYLRAIEDIVNLSAKNRVRLY